MDGIGTRLGTIVGLRVFDFPPDNVHPPTAVVGMPETMEFDSTMARGADRTVIPVAILVGKVSDRASRDELAAYVSGTGAKSVKAAVDGNLGGAAQTARVTTARIEVVTVAGVDYLGARFDVEVFD